MLAVDLRGHWLCIPLILKPFLYCGVWAILVMIQLSDEPKPASAPVSGWMKPITMSLAPPPPVVDVEPPLAPLMLELQASSRLPPPTTTALAPAVRSRPRRLHDPGGGGPPPPPPPPLGGGGAPPPPPPPPPPRAPRDPPGSDVLSGRAVWSLMCNRSPFEVAPMARDRV